MSMSLPLPISRKDAKLKGLTKYFTGKPCGSGHVAERWSGNGSCKECSRKPNNARAAAWARENPEKVRATNLRKYNLSLEQYKDILLNQDNACAICQSKDPLVGSFAVDHDHKCCAENKESCGKCVRGLLCANCNQGLGKFKDNPELLVKAAEYLKRTPITCQ